MKTNVRVSQDSGHVNLSGKKDSCGHSGIHT